MPTYLIYISGGGSDFFSSAEPVPGKIISDPHPGPGYNQSEPSDVQIWIMLGIIAEDCCLAFEIYHWNYLSPDLAHSCKTTKLQTMCLYGFCYLYLHIMAKPIYRIYMLNSY